METVIHFDFKALCATFLEMIAVVCNAVVFLNGKELISQFNITKRFMSL